MTSLKFLVSLLLLGAGPACAQSEAPLSYKWAETAPAEAAGTRLLGPLATLYPNFSGPRTGNFSRGRLEVVAFSSGARASGMEGVCEADVVWLTFTSDREMPWAEPPDGGAETAPVAIRSMRTETRFRAIGDTAPGAWTEDSDAELDAACAAQTDGWEFGLAEDRFDAWVAVRLQTLLPDMAANDPQALLSLLDTCAGAECGAPLLLVAELQTARFMYGDIRPCDGLVDIYSELRSDGPSCLVAKYQLGRAQGEVESLVVASRFETKLSADQSTTLDPHLLQIAIRRESIIED